MSLLEIVSDELNALDAYPLSFKVEEGMSANAAYALEVECRSAEVDFDPLLGKKVTVSVELPGGRRRPFNAWIIAGADRGQQGTHFVYQFRLSGWLWFLQQNRNCRIFQNLNVPDIVTQIFSRYGAADYRFELEGTYPPREYCVQFAESDFDFVSRLLEDEGISYVTEHGEDRHTLVIQDRQTWPLLDAPWQGLRYIPDGEEGRAIREGIQRIRRQRRVSPNEIVLRDFDYLNPRNNLQTRAEQQDNRLRETPLQWYDYATGYRDTERGERLAQIRLQELQAQGLLLNGESNATGLRPARRFALSLHPDPQRNRGYKLLRCDYDFIQDGPDSSSQGRNVICRFIAINDDIAWRPPRVTPRPQMSGLQSATVVGPAESEVHTDQHGRIRVHFHWDRDKSHEEDCSCWIRVVQAWAGKGWGVLAMPRVGQEVLITYLDGSPDRPVVTGIVYNGDNPPPYRLPEQINYSGLVSRSLKFGQPQHASQLTFDDKRGGERVMMHAERDLQTSVERNSATDVGQDLYQVVTRTLTEQLQNAVSYKANAIGVTGNSVAATGNQASLTGNAVSLSGNNLSVTGNGSAFTGMSSAVIGSSLSTTGSSVSLTGCSSSCTGSSTAVIGDASNFTASSTSFLGQGTAFTGVSSSMTGVSSSMTGSEVVMTGSSTMMYGSMVQMLGSWVNFTASVFMNNGSNITNIGSSIITTGSSITTTGVGVSVAGASMQTVGVKMSN
ncbi:type VI secretion system Vgr family protein [Erwinia sp. B116]|uniref:type VI secretion system Vgr family protein n=1 Tax=Erwinia sp. B116 TaxID=1561024 RepID=UPI000C75AAB4|nr:type VI secretion system tip protein VgrG [Erwinia sp. B116]PLV61752.1 type IV secretion protein Rhs [Erwinia sp. B116]